MAKVLCNDAGLQEKGDRSVTIKWSRVLCLLAAADLSLVISAAEIPLASQLDTVPAGRILFASERQRDTLSIVSMNTKGTDLRQHVPASVARRGDYEPSVSPDGKSVAFTTYRYGGWKIAISDLEGGPARRVTMDPQYVYDASWSPDGKQLVYRRIVNRGGAYFRGNGDIFVINTDGTGNRNLTADDTEHARNPSFSPDGAQVVYDAFVGDDLHVVRINANGRQKLRLPTGGMHAFAPCWSPDGEWIAHLRQDDEGHTDVWVMQPDGSDARNLTRSKSNSLPAIGERIPHWQYGTHWSPDGEWIAFVADYAEPGNVDIYLISVRDQTLARLTRLAGTDTHPFWYADQ